MVLCTVSKLRVVVGAKQMAPTAKPNRVWPLGARLTPLTQNGLGFVIYLGLCMDQFQKYRLLIVIMRCMKKVKLFLFFFEICIFFRMPDLKFKAGTDRRNCASVFTSLISMAAKQFTRTLECPFRPTNVNQTNLSFNHPRIKFVDLHWNYEISKVQNAGDYIPM